VTFSFALLSDLLDFADKFVGREIKLPGEEGLLRNFLQRTIIKEKSNISGCSKKENKLEWNR